ncbi:MAG: ATPase, partial [Desulfuromonadales bacterium]|nr:ATPase [Desulfuromonadales bacterium]
MTQRNLQATLCKSLVLAGLVLVPAVAIASGDGGHAESGVILKDFLYRCFSFALMVGLLAYFVTKPIRKGLKERSAGIEKA